MFKRKPFQAILNTFSSPGFLVEIFSQHSVAAWQQEKRRTASIGSWINEKSTYVDCKDVNNIRSNQVLDLGIQNYIQKDIQGDIPDREFRECIQGWLWRELWGGLTVTTSRGNYITFIYLSLWKLALKKCSKSERKFLLSESVDCSL